MDVNAFKILTTLLNSFIYLVNEEIDSAIKTKTQSNSGLRETNLAFSHVM